MIRPTLLLAIVVLVPAPSPCQLPSVMARPGTLRIEFGGAFSPADLEFVDGTERELGLPVSVGNRNVSTSPLVSDMATRISALTGIPSPGGVIGSLSADLSFERSMGNIGLMLGVTSRISAFANIPIVSVRTDALIEQSADGATLGLNPVLAGNAATGQFFDSFDGSIDELRGRIEAGDFIETPEIDAAAREWFTEANLLRDALADLLHTEGRLSAVLPLTGSEDATALLGVIQDARTRFVDEFGVTAPIGTPAFPTIGLTDEDLSGILSSPEGYGLLAFDSPPLVSLGDVELGVAYRLHSRGIPGRGRWSGAWLLGSGTLATGTAPRRSVIRGQGTGDRQSDLVATAIGEVGSNRLGVRAELSYRVQQSTDMLVRVGDIDEHLRPVSRTSALNWDPGDELTITARPFLRLADNLAIAGSVSYFKHGPDSWSYVGGATPSSGGDPITMGEGSERSMINAGLGLSYSHNGTNRFGVVTMPVEAGLSLSRPIHFGSGIIRSGLTTTVWFRVSKPIF